MGADRRAERRAALLATLGQEGLQGLIVTHLPNVRYLTGFSGTSGVAIVLERETVFLSDFRYEAQAAVEVGDAARIEIVGQDLWARVWEVLREYAGIERLGFEAHAVTVSEAERFRRGDVPWSLVPAGDLVERLRVSKTPEEIAAIREAASLAHAALAMTLVRVRVGQSERHVAAGLEAELRERGSEWHPFPTIVASGPRTALPHARTSDRVLEAGDWLLIDFGAQVRGYCCDITRTMVVGGPADERQQTVYHAVRQAQRTAREQVRPGMSGKEADRLARAPLEAWGFGDAFGHSLGHGLGLEVHEAPRLSRTVDAVLPQHAVVTIEPGVYLPGWGGVRIEDDVHLAPEGPELLTDGETQLVELTG